jgi:hypothetical protein
MRKKLTVIAMIIALFALVACGANDDKDKNGNQPWQVAMKASQNFVKGNKKAIWNQLTNEEKKRTIIIQPNVTSNGLDKKDNIDKDYRIVEYKNPKDLDTRYYTLSHTFKLGRTTDYVKVVKEKNVWKIDGFEMNDQDFRLATEGMKAQKIDLTKGE